MNQIETPEAGIFDVTSSLQTSRWRTKKQGVVRSKSVVSVFAMNGFVQLVLGLLLLNVAATAQETAPAKAQTPSGSEDVNAVKKTPDPVEVLSDTMGVDFRPYLENVKKSVRQSWYALVPSIARPPVMKKGHVVIEFAIKKDGGVTEIRRVVSSGDLSLDRAAWGGISDFESISTFTKRVSGGIARVALSLLLQPRRF